MIYTIMLSNSSLVDNREVALLSELLLFLVQFRMIQETKRMKSNNEKEMIKGDREEQPSK
jgi:hypothetical protein